MSFDYWSIRRMQYFLEKLKAKIPTKVSDLTNDSGFVTTDNKVLQAVENESKEPINTINTNLRVLLSSNNSDSASTAKSYKSSELYFNPRNAVLMVANAKATASDSSLESRLNLGANIAEGSAGATHGVLRLYGKNVRYVNIYDNYNVLTDNRVLYLPNRSGYIATSNIIATDETALTTVSGVKKRVASQAYSTGDHFVINNYFCTATTDIASGVELTENTNYVVGNVADFLTTQSALAISLVNWLTFPYATSGRTVYRTGNTVHVRLRVTISSMPTLTGAVNIIELPWAMQGHWCFAWIHSQTSPYPVYDTAMYIQSDAKYLRIPRATTLPDGDYYIQCSYNTNEPL